MSFDCMTLGRRYDFLLRKLSTIKKAPVQNADFLAGSLFQDRVSIRSKSGRKALQQHAQSMRKKSVSTLTGKEFEAMTADLTEGKMPSLQQFLGVRARF